MITPTKQLAAEALEELSDVLDFIASEKGEEDPMYLALSGVEEKLHIILRRLSKPVVQQLPRNNDDYAFMAQSEDI